MDLIGHGDREDDTIYSIQPINLGLTLSTRAIPLDDSDQSDKSSIPSLNLPSFMAGHD